MPCCKYDETICSKVGGCISTTEWTCLKCVEDLMWNKDNTDCPCCKGTSVNCPCITTPITD